MKAELASLRGSMLLVLGLVLALSGCAQPQQQPTVTPSLRPAQLPIQPTKMGPRTPLATPEVRGPRLPGRLVFVSAGNIWVWEKDSAHQLTFSGDAAQPALSPDGTKIALIVRRPSASNLALLPIGESQPQLLTDYESTQPIGSLERVYESMWAFYPTFAPDGSQIAFASQGGPPVGSPASEYRLSIFLIQPLTGATRNQIFAEHGISAGRSVFTPDGKALLFALSPDAAEPAHIQILDLESSVSKPLASAPEQSYDPAVSPDGKWLAYAARSSAGTSIFVSAMHADGEAASASQALRVGDFIAARAPAFSPDGKHLAFLVSLPGERGFDLWFADLAQDKQGAITVTQLQRLTSDMMIDADSGLSWR